MPEIDGADFYRAAVAQRHELAERFLFITGTPPVPRRGASCRIRASPVLGKPFTPQALLRAVEQVSA